MIYRFRVKYEEYEDFYRDIDIQTLQSFEDLKDAILKTMEFDNVHGFEMFVSDDYWRRGRDLTKKKDGTEMPLSKRILCDFIDDPHQRFLFIYDLNVQWAFLIELIKITNDEPKTKYPLLSKSLGHPPKQYKKIILPANVENEELADGASTKMKRGRKAGVQKQIDPLPAELDEDEDDDADEIEADNATTAFNDDELDLNEGFTEESDPDAEKESNEEGDDEFGESYGESGDDGYASSGGEDDY